MKDVNGVKTEGSIRARHRRRWPWVVPLLLGIVGVAGAVVRNRRPPQPHLERWPSRPVEPPTSQYCDQVATGGSPTGNGVVRADRPSAGTD